MPAPVKAPVAAPEAPGVQLVAVAAALTSLLECETAFVRGLKIAEIGPLQAEKVRLTKLLQEALKPLTAGKTLPPAAKAKWQEAGRRLADAVIANERALRIGRSATERLVATVVKAVTDMRRPLKTYAPPRRRANGAASRDLSGVALDRRL